ncbi:MULTISPECIES: hypothetical protein [Gluconobacter]|uniref:Uncharacterized protein n=2 Tax=Gluconobacter TaxID=441 RepID=A0A4Y3M4D1_9PROT|nr:MULTISPECIES: hypothetical protein [Gluconobacter]KXV42718.1 hypothetical protein AD943_11620 [Gluconobacter roseus]MBF0859141.1 hypothetical protein [Gluconobacter vitians]GBR49312.1 hypothetical protein AA3990_2469 [Gluconobacter roseus NBRC 3990]GEB04162.1 hypothetical protein GRO01_17380 [Gluconobacter roseus NBRC 3990]GLP92606.1 hypothetical protein GCM10007871_05840 [Gluconobacter roseus NBRC 3990]
MSILPRFPKTDPVIWKRIGLSYLIALPLLYIMFRHQPAHPNMLIQLLGFLLIIMVSRLLARLILRTDK